MDSYAGRGQTNECVDGCLGLFAKYWEPGRVKTRLAASIGTNKAVALYKLFLETLAARTNQLSGLDRVLVYSPPQRKAEFCSLVGRNNTGNDWQFEPQNEGDLGTRMKDFISTSLQRKPKVIIVGSDSPTVPMQYIHQARQLLDMHDVVLGPSDDGGYYLLAVRQQSPPIFTNIEWSTNRVWSQTIQRLQQHRVNFAVLPTWYDVDEQNDLTRLRIEISNENISVKATYEIKRLQQQLEAILMSAEQPFAERKTDKQNTSER